MRRTSLIMTLVVLLASLFLLSVLSNILTGYPEHTRLPETPKKREAVDVEEEPSVLLFKVSPSTPHLYWRIWSGDYYTGTKWLKTTQETIIEEFPRIQAANVTRVFTVEVNSSQREVFLPVASPNSTLRDISIARTEGLEFYSDTVGNVFKVLKLGQANEAPLVYNVSWSDAEVDDRLVSLDGIPEEVLNKYLQLPNLSLEVLQLAKDLEDSSYSVLDQILADVQFLKTNFVYDFEHSKRLYERVVQGSDISYYLRQRRGVCIDAATALAVILRAQKIPARISVGYKPERIERGKLLFYTSGAHSVTEVYLPPYGWIQFDATPPPEENPLVKVVPFKREVAPGSKIYCQLSITNRRNETDRLKLYASSNKQKWNIETAPEELRIEAYQTADALLEVTVPDNASLGEKDYATVTVASLNHPAAVFSILAVIQVKNVSYISTTTMLKEIDEIITRGDTFWVNGTVLTADSEQIDNMTVFVFLTKSELAKGIIIGKGYSKQGNFQIESQVPHFTEIGDYKVVSISLGTTLHASSSTDSTTRVRATTRMELGPEDSFLLGYGAIHGRLFWDNGTELPGAPISLKITSSATPIEVWEIRNKTLDDGSFRIETSFENSGTYEIEATFSGNAYILGSSAKQTIELTLALPVIQIFDENAAVRGEVFNITGTVQFEDIGVWGEPVTVTFDDQLLATVETGRNGSYAYSFLVDPEERLGPHTFTLALEKGNVSAVHKVVVKSKTTLTTKVSPVAGGTLLLFSASLSDDHDLPVRGAEIAIEDYGLSWKTDKNGNVTFLLDNVELWPENLTLTASFEGSESHLPATTEKEIALEPVISLPFLIPLVSSILGVMVFVYAKHFVGRWRTSRQASNIEVAKDRAITEKPATWPQEKQPLTIVFPDIKPQFPNVWGVKDKLRIEIVLEKSALKRMQERKVEVFVDEQTAASLRFYQQGRAQLSYVFIKEGEHNIHAILQRTMRRPPLKAEVRLRVVNYREEIIRLYNEFLAKLASYDVHARNEMTAQEIESLILTTDDFNQDALHKVTTCFEQAEYSNRLSIREDYEAMYLSLKELNIEIE